MYKEQLYETIIRNISKEIKHILNEGLENFDIVDYEDNENQLIDNQTIDTVLNYSPSFITNYALRTYKKLYKKCEKVLDKLYNKGIIDGKHVDILMPYIELDNEEFDDIDSLDKTLCDEDGNKENAKDTWKTIITFIQNNESNKSTSLIFGLYIDDLYKSSDKAIYNFLLRFLDYIKNDIDYCQSSIIGDEDNIYHYTCFELDIYNNDYDIYINICNIFKVFEKYIDYLQNEFT